MDAGGDPQPATTATCCIVGCGPAGAMLGLMLARSGVDVLVLEKYPDFLRDFRGDTIHASTLQVIEELGLLRAFERLPQQRTTSIAVRTDTESVTLGDFRRLPGAFQYISMVPQWDFLDFLTAEARRYPAFGLLQRAEVFELVEEQGVVEGVRYRTPHGVREVRALLTVACDGRHSVVRREAGLAPIEFGAPMDVLWFRLPKHESDPAGTFARLAPGRLIPMIDRRTYWQGAYTMPKGSFADLQAQGIDKLRGDLRAHLPFLGDRVDAITGWQDVGFLEVRVDRLTTWHRPGLLCIGDAAHAMSPIGGVGINLAIQDAVAAGNRLAVPLLRGRVSSRDLEGVQRRREWPTRMTQRLQLLMQRNMISPVLESQGTAELPRWLVAALRSGLPGRVLARFMALGFRTEHVRPSMPLPGVDHGAAGSR